MPNGTGQALLDRRTRTRAADDLNAESTSHLSPPTAKPAYRGFWLQLLHGRVVFVDRARV